jgi:hypothetical protein
MLVYQRVPSKIINKNHVKLGDGRGVSLGFNVEKWDRFNKFPFSGCLKWMDHPWDRNW